MQNTNTWLESGSARNLLDLMDARYRRIREFLPRKRFFNDLRALACYLCFDSWDALMAFMIEKLELDVPDTS